MNTKTESALLIALACAKVQPPVDVRADGAGPARPEPGTYARGDVRLLLSYDLRVGPSTRRRVSAAIPWQRLALLALGRLNTATAEALVREAMGDAPLAEDPTPRIRGIVDELQAGTEREVAGRVDGNAFVLEVPSRAPARR